MLFRSKDVIIPSEEHLDRQEHFVEYREKAIQDAKKAEIERRMAEEEEAKKKTESEERERLRIENERFEHLLDPGFFVRRCGVLRFVVVHGLCAPLVRRDIASVDYATLRSANARALK